MVILGLTDVCRVGGKIKKHPDVTSLYIMSWDIAMDTCIYPPPSGGNWVVIDQELPSVKFLFRPQRYGFICVPSHFYPTFFFSIQQNTTFPHAGLPLSPSFFSFLTPSESTLGEVLEYSPRNTPVLLWQYSSTASRVLEYCPESTRVLSLKYSPTPKASVKRPFHPILTK